MDKGGGAANGRLCRLFLYIVMLRNRRKSGKLEGGKTKGKMVEFKGILLMGVYDEKKNSGNLRSGPVGGRSAWRMQQCGIGDRADDGCG